MANYKIVYDSLKWLAKNVDNLDYHSVESIIDNLSFRMPSIADYHPSTPPQFQRIYRARVADRKTYRSTFKHIADLLYPPDDIKSTIKWGRANLPKQQMFYGGFYELNSCVEVIPPENNLNAEHYFVVGEWTIIGKVVLARLPNSTTELINLPAELNIQNMEHRLQRMNENNEAIKQMKWSSEEEYQILQFFGDQFAKVRIKSEKDYIFTNYYAQRQLNCKKYEMKWDETFVDWPTDDNLDGIKYASTRTSLELENIVLLPSSIDDKNKFHFLRAKLLRLRNNTPFGTGTQLEQLAICQSVDEEGNIKW